MIKKLYYGRGGSFTGPEINQIAEFNILIRENGEDKINDLFGNKGDFGVGYTNAEEEMIILVSDKEDKLFEELEDWIYEDRKYAQDHKVKRPLFISDVAFDLTEQEKIERLIKMRKKILEKRNSAQLQNKSKI
jgi:hypothetical protein